MKTRLKRIPDLVDLFYPNRLWSQKDNSKIYLTFDDGPHPQITPWLIEFLKFEKIKASFFLLGKNVDSFPELYQEIKNEKHTIGSHGYLHLKYQREIKDEYYANFLKGRQVIESEYFRPPYGKIDKSMVRRIGVDVKIVMWKWMSFDFDESVSDDEIFASSNQVRKGDITVFHENEKSISRIQRILPVLVERFRKRGFEFAAL